MFVHDAQMAREVDSNAIHTLGIPSMVLMERAAMACCDQIRQYVNKTQVIGIVCGPGNNGGDGFAIARNLVETGYRVKTFFIGHQMSIDQRHEYTILQKLDIPVMDDIQVCIQEMAHLDWIVDCIFGNGLNKEVQGSYRDVIEAMNESEAKVLSIDVPSGLDATSGKILGCAVHCDVCIALDCFKTGHFINDGKMIIPSLVGVNIGIPSKLHPPKYRWVDKDVAKALLPVRTNHGHKGSFGKALLIGGSQSMHGAITYVAKACNHSGIGTCTLMIPDCIGDILANKMAFSMQIRCPSDKDGYFGQGSLDVLRSHMSAYDMIVIGNGMGRTKTTEALVKFVLSSDLPVLLDADAFWCLRNETKYLKRESPTICTPHVKELSYLIGWTVQEIVENPFGASTYFKEMYPNCTLVLKSDITIIDEYVYAYGNSALSKGGSGDILCGIIAGLYGQCKDPVQSSVCGCWIHSMCATIKKDPAAVQPDDVIDQINLVLMNLREG